MSLDGWDFFAVVDAAAEDIQRVLDDLEADGVDWSELEGGEDHRAKLEAFVEAVDGAPFQFYPPDPEEEDGLVQCAQCETYKNVSDMAMNLDASDSFETDAGEEVTIRVTRLYLCSDDCAARLMTEGAERLEALTP